MIEIYLNIMFIYNSRFQSMHKFTVSSHKIIVTDPVYGEGGPPFEPLKIQTNSNT